MCSSSCLCNCCNSEIDTIYPIRSLAFYLLQNIKKCNNKKNSLSLQLKTSDGTKLFKFREKKSHISEVRSREKTELSSAKTENWEIWKLESKLNRRKRLSRNYLFERGSSERRRKNQLRKSLQTDLWDEKQTKSLIWWENDTQTLKLLSGSEHQKGMLRDSSRDTISDRFLFIPSKIKRWLLKTKMIEIGWFSKYMKDFVNIEKSESETSFNGWMTTTTTTELVLCVSDI